MANEIRLVDSVRAYNSPDFRNILKQEIAALERDLLPLQQGLSTGNYVSEAPFSVMISSVLEVDDLIRVKAGIFYQGIIGGCSCTDDPTPVSDINEYCEIVLDINKSTALATVKLESN